MAVGDGRRHNPSPSHPSALIHLKVASRSAPAGTPRLRIGSKAPVPCRNPFLALAVPAPCFCLFEPVRRADRGIVRLGPSLGPDRTPPAAPGARPSARALARPDVAAVRPPKLASLVKVRRLGC